MEDARFTTKTRRELAHDLGIASSTLRYKLNQLGLKTKPGLLTTDEIVQIYLELGYKSRIPEALLAGVKTPPDDPE